MRFLTGHLNNLIGHITMWDFNKMVEVSGLSQLFDFGLTKINSEIM